jgi:hypothetical protein
MKRGPTIFLQVVVVLVGIGTLTAMLWEPHLEGVNAHATTLSEIYFDDPFLVYAYIGSIPFFVALYQAFKVLGYVRQGKVFSPETLKALRTIKYGVLITAAAVVAADVFLMIAARGSGEDAAGAVMLGIIATFILIVIATTATVFEGILHNKEADGNHHQH